MTDNDFAYLIDFGIARGAGDTALTSANTTIGTWAYMAPERFRSGESAAASDVYALACVLYQCLTGDPPYPGDTLEQVAVGHLVTPPPRPSDDQSTVPAALDHVVAVGLAKEPADRYPTTIALAAAAQQAIAGDPFGATGPTQPAALPTQEWPTDSGVPPAPAPAVTRRGRRRGILIGALAATALLVAGGVIAAVNMSDDGRSTTAIPPSTAAPSPPTRTPNTGPFTGLYRVDFGRGTRLDGVGDPNAAPSTGTYGLRSVCRPAGCVATASKFNGDIAFAPSMVFDQVGPSWLAVALAPSPCKNITVDTWQVFTLQPQPDGSLAGEFIRLTPTQCQEKRPVTFTRTGDVDVDADFRGLPDPDGLPPRVVSPAEALRGSYRVARTYTGMGTQQLGESAVTTYCLRAGDRCMSYFSVAAGDLPLIFEGGSWSWKDETDGPCPNGDMSHLSANAQFPLPQPPQNPIPELSGRGTWVQTGSCAVNLDITETFTRTGE